MEVLCCVCDNEIEVGPGDREIVCMNCLTPLMVYEDGTTEPM